MKNCSQFLLDAKQVRFIISDTGTLSVVLSDGKAYSRVHLLRTFPISAPEEFISICDAENKEIGVINRLTDLPVDQQKLIRKELHLRYVIPVIINIIEIKKGPNAFKWDVETDRGKKTFYVKERNEQLTFINKYRILVTDIENCRYDINDLRKLSGESIHELEKVI